MGRARGRKRRRRTPAQAAGRARRTPRAPRPPSPAERQLLGLARDLAGLARGTLPAPAVAQALERLAAAWAPGALLPREVYQAWLRNRGDKDGALALGWAREQVRLAFEDLLARAPVSLRLARPDALAWLLLAACESLALESTGAARDRLRFLLDVIGQGEVRR
jgi:hypothetical protein